MEAGTMSFRVNAHNLLSIFCSRGPNTRSGRLACGDPYAPRCSASFLIGASLLACLLAVPVWAQWRTPDAGPNLSAPAPKTPDGKTSMAGIWMRVPPPNGPASNPAGIPGRLDWYVPKGVAIPMQPWAQKLFDQRAAKFGAGRPSQRCLPHGIPDAMLYGGPLKIVHSPGLTIFLYESFTHFRQIFTDGRPFPRDPEPAWFGYSVGKWDGDAFVVDTVGFNDQTWLDDTGLPHTEAMHSTERFRRRDFGHLEMQLTIDDPKAYTKPWSVTIGFDLLTDADLIEMICENERDNQHIDK
jgi:hypothetical protein